MTGGIQQDFSSRSNLTYNMPALTNTLANHIAISVSDGEAAVKWYKEVLGLREIVPLQTFSASGPQSDPTLKRSTPYYIARAVKD
jgi:catechol-2,3-dioxygenase